MTSKHKIMDQTQDHDGRNLYALLQQYTVPDFVKNASSEDIFGSESDKLPGHVFGDPVSRRFPCHTPAASWVSAAFLFTDGSVPGEQNKQGEWIGQRIYEAARKYGISTHIEVLQKEAREFNNPRPPQLHDDDFALIVHTKEGKERHYPLRNALEVKEAAAYVVNYRDQLPFADRAEMAEKILAKADKYGAALDSDTTEFLEKQAGMGGCSPEDAAKLIMSRVEALGRMDKPTELQIELGKMAAACLEHPEQLRAEGSLHKLAQVLDEIDRATGLNRDYGDSLERPEDVLFYVTRKAASQMLAEHCQMTSGKVYRTDDFNRLKLRDVGDMMGEEFADLVSSDGLRVSPEKLAEQAATLPRTDAALIERLLEDVGIMPVYKEASYNQPKMTKDDWRKLAQQRALATLND